MIASLVVLTMVILIQAGVFIWTLSRHIEECEKWQLERASLLDRIMARDFDALSMARTQEKTADNLSETEETPVYYDDLNEDDFVGPEDFIAGIEKEGE